MDKKKLDKLLTWAATGLLGILLLKEFILFLVLVVLSAALQTWCYSREIKLSFGQVFFLSILMSRLEGAGGAVLFILAGGMLPEIMTGNLEAKTVIAYPLMAGFATFAAYVPGLDIVIVGILLSLIYHALLYIISGAVGESLPEKILEVILPLLMNLIYFTSFSRDLLTLFTGFKLV
ncbi:MAG: hypothetical protein HGA85_03210 [Nanoarchaeota archaeon]|nr:hypothetical protein [Nanoarchaeota archaeon]